MENSTFPMLLSLEQVSKVFRTEEIETTALREVSLQVANGEFLAVMGPSGCGKSTLLALIGMLDTPTHGRYVFAGEDVTDYGEDRLAVVRKRGIGFVFQSFNLIDEMTVFENIELALVYHQLPANARRKIVHDVIERLNIGHRINHFPSQLSGGQQQRVAVARALVAAPALILADEPTGNLDTHNGEEVMRLLRELNDQGTTVLMVTHSERHALYAHRTVHLLDGQIVGAQEQRSLSSYHTSSLASQV